MTKPFTDRILWSAIIQSFEYYSEEKWTAEKIKPHMEIKSIFKEDADSFYLSFKKIDEYLKKEYRIEVELDIKKEELLAVFEVAEDVFLYYHFKINSLDKIAKKIMDRTGQNNS